MSDSVKTVLLASLVAFVVAFAVASIVGGNTVVQRIAEPLGADGDTDFTNVVASQDVTAGNDLVVSGKATVAGSIINTADTITSTTTLTTDSSGLQLLAASANMSTITLPAATAGLQFTFLVTGALTGSSVVIDSAEGDNIEGLLMVNSADVVCSGEDQLNIVTDGEVVGDRVTIISDGTSWYIGDSDIDAAGKMTCTDPS